MYSPIQHPDISGAANNAVTNLTDKPTKIIGDMISDLLQIPATKIRLYSRERCEKLQADFEKRIYENLDSIPSEKLVAPNPQIIGPAIEESTYCLGSDDLTEMFAALIANSCNYDYCQYVHPAFAHTIAQLSPYDAMLFKKMAPYNSVGAAQYILRSKIDRSKLCDNYSVKYDCIPYVDSPFDNFDIESLSISALKYLGLIEYHVDRSTSTAGKKFYECPKYLEMLNYYKHQEYAPDIIPYRIYITPYGKALAKACSLRPNI